MSNLADHAPTLAALTDELGVEYGKTYDPVFASRVVRLNSDAVIEAVAHAEARDDTAPYFLMVVEMINPDGLDCHMMVHGDLAGGTDEMARLGNELRPEGFHFVRVVSADLIPIIKTVRLKLDQDRLLPPLGDPALDQLQEYVADKLNAAKAEVQHYRDGEDMARRAGISASAIFRAPPTKN